MFFENNINLDPCSNSDSIVRATTKYILPVDGLMETWNFKNIYVNPPYGRDKQRKTSIKNWIKKCCHSHEEYNSEVVALIPVATNTSHWKEYIYNKSTAICFLYDTRVKFRINGSEENKGSPMACCFVYWGARFDKFKELFSDLGFVVKIDENSLNENDYQKST